MPRGQSETTSVAAREQFLLAMRSVPPHGTDCVDDPFGRQTVAFRDFGLAGCTSVQCAAFLQQAWAGCAMNGPIHAAASEQTRVRRVDDGIDLLSRDVAFDDLESIIQPNNSLIGLPKPSRVT